MSASGVVGVLAGVAWVLFGWLFYRERRRLLNALILALAIVFTGVFLDLMFVTPDGAHPIIGVAMFGVFVVTMLLPGALVINGLVMLRREGRSLGNLLSLLVGLVLGVVVLAPFVTLITSSITGQWVFAWLAWLEIGAAGFTAYLGLLFACYLIYGWICVHYPSRRPADAVVVLGSGLVRGQVSPLLAARLDAGIKAYQRLKSAGHPVILVPSGGQGSDEPRPEGEAMAEYLIAKGVPAEDVVPEIESRTTRENITHSVALVAARQPRGSYAPPRLLIATNNYHTLRAALLSRRVGVRADTVGAPTAGYFLPSALIREFIALLVASRAWHIFVGVCCLLGTVWMIYVSASLT